MRRILLDTNVLVDYYLGRQPGCDACCRLVERVGDSLALYVASLSLKDCYYHITMSLKRASRADDGTLSPESAQAAAEVGWACVRQALDFVQVLPVGQEECLQALVYRPLHNDFEDDLVLAAGLLAKVDFVVTSDERLQRHAPFACLAPQDMVKFLEAESS